jgi:hypothetical protein
VSEIEGIDHDLTLLGLAERVNQFEGRIEDMSDDERVYLLGLFAGAVDRLRERVRELWTESRDEGSYEAMPGLYQVMLAMGASENWAEESGQHDG